MNFQQYEIEDFLTDESFLNYCAEKNSDDILFWETWLLNNPEKRVPAGEAKTLYAELRQELNLRNKTQKDLEDFKRLFLDHIPSPDRYEESELMQSRSFFRKNAVSLAAAASVILVLSYFFRPGQHEYPKTLPVAQVKSIPQNSTKKTMRLPDGTLVTLNPNSRIEIDKDFNGKDRIVRLEGEALFEVAEDKEKPFIVKAGNTFTTALGTAFMVRYYSHEAEVKVSLLTGKVKVEQVGTKVKSGNAVYLTPGSQVVINKKISNTAPKRQTFHADDLKAWKLDFLAFSDAEFNEIVVKLEDWFGVKIDVQNAPEITKHFTGDFKNENLETVLEALAFAHKFAYQIKPDSVIIQFKPMP
ncbi:DUF4974 domain-containing protein [Flavihumibacter sp. R14]|nr:DUF4974 domain-containing protein [Flavihumibacter soli]